MAKPEYKCILYEKGDKVKSRFNNLFDSETVYEIEDTEFKYVGLFPTLFLKLVGKPRDITDLSNYYIPAEETIEKYKDGLKYFNETKVTSQKTRGTKTPNTSTFKPNFRRSKDNTLTEEDLKPRVMPAGTFSVRPPDKKEI